MSFITKRVMPLFTKSKETPADSNTNLHHNDGAIQKYDHGTGKGRDYRKIGEDESKKYGYNPRYRVAHSTQNSAHGYNRSDKDRTDSKHGSHLEREDRKLWNTYGKKDEHKQLNQTGGLKNENNAQGLSDTESVESLIQYLQESRTDSALSEIGQVLEKQQLLINKLMNEREMVAKRSDENISRESQTERSKNNDGRHKERKLSMNYDKETQTDERKSCELRDRETQTIRRLVYSQRTQTDDENQTNDESGSKENKWGVWTYLFPPTGQTKKDEESQTEYLCHLDEIVRPCDIRWLQEEYLHAQGEIERLKVELLRSVNTSELSQQPAPPIIRKVGVEIYNPGQATDIVQLMEESLKRDLQSRLSAHNVKIEFNTTSGGGGKLSAPAIVLCPNFSRLGTDVNSAFSGLQDSGDGTVLLVVYYKEEHNLPKVKSEQILSQFNRLGAILDMGFTKDRGFYPTNINHQSFECLVHFVLKYVI